MALPYKIATLLYAFNERDEILLMERAREPNRGYWSPPGGKLDTASGESPYACACREALEEMGLVLTPASLHLAGVVSEHGYMGQAHWLMFLFEIKNKLTAIPPEHPEGRFAFFTREAMKNIPIPGTDLEQIWPLFWQHRGGFFSAHCITTVAQPNHWILEESIPRV